MSSLNKKQISLLTNMTRKSPVIAPWSNRDLVALSQLGFVEETVGWAADGRVSGSKVWTITDKGRRFIDEERCAQ